MADNVREMTFDEEYEILQKEKEELFAMEKEDCEPPFANCVVRRALRCIRKLLEEIQQYREIETELREKYHANVDIKMLMQHFIETIFKGEKHEGFCILTNEDAEMWGAYKAIGTVEECRTAVERMKPSSKVRGISLTHDVGRVGNCPNCNRFVVEKYNDYCPKCRKKLAWSE